MERKKKKYLKFRMKENLLLKCGIEKATYILLGRKIYMRTEKQHQHKKTNANYKTQED